MHTIWAPWRGEYVIMKKTSRCIFCAAKRSSARDMKRYVLKRTRYALSILNRYPYNNGHVIVAPKRHVSTLELLKSREILDLVWLVNHTKKKIDRTLKPLGYNIGLNVGREAGAGFPGHVHIHIVPRWKGDTNFMPVLSDTKVMASSLDSMLKLLAG